MLTDLDTMTPKAWQSSFKTFIAGGFDFFFFFIPVSKLERLIDAKN